LCGRGESATLLVEIRVTWPERRLWLETVDDGAEFTRFASIRFESSFDDG